MIMVKEKGAADASLYTKYTRQSVNSKLTLGDKDIRAPPASRVSIVSQSPYGVNMPVSFQFRFGGQSADRYVTLSDVLLSIISGTTRNLILNFNLSRPGQLPVGVQLYRNTSASTTGGTLIASSTVPPTFTSSNLYPYYHYYSKATLNSAEYTSNVVNTNNTLIETFAGRYYSYTGGGEQLGSDGVPVGDSTVRFANPRSVMMAPNRDVLYIADSGNSRIRAVNLTSAPITLFNKTIQPNYIDTLVATSSGVADIAVSIDGSIYDNSTAYVRKWNPANGTSTNIAGTGTFGNSGESGLATSAQIAPGQAIVLSRDERFLIIPQFEIPNPGATPPVIGYAHVRCINLTSNPIVVAGITINGNCIRRIAGLGYGTSGGANGDGGEARLATFRNNRGLAISPDDKVLYIADADDNVIRAVNLSDTTVRVFGKNIQPGYIDRVVDSTISPGINALRAVDVDSLGNLYLSDQGGCTLRRVDAITNVMTIISGTYSSAASSTQPNNVPTTQGLWGAIRGVTFDSENNIYCVDASNAGCNVIRKIY